MTAYPTCPGRGHHGLAQVGGELVVGPVGEEGDEVPVEGEHVAAPVGEDRGARVGEYHDGVPYLPGPGPFSVGVIVVSLFFFTI